MKRFSELFTSGERLIGTVAATVLVLLVGYLTIHRYHINESLDAQAEAKNQIDLIYSEITEIVGVTTSLATLYRVATDVGSDQLEQYTEELLDVSKTVASIGRFDRIEKADIDLHTDLMSERGIYRFEIKSLLADGSTLPANNRPHYDALVSINPFTPSSAGLIGVDVSNDPKLRDTLSRAIDRNRPFVTRYPQGWPGRGHVLLLQPTYAGRYIPQESVDRQFQNDGGYVMDLSFASLLVGGELTQTELALPGGRILRRNSVDSSRRFFEPLLRGYATQLSPLLGGSPLHITIRAKDGVPWLAVQQALVRIAGCVILIWVAVLLMMSKRYSDHHRKSAQSSLKKEREIALTTLEALNDSVFTVDRKGAISYVNPAASSMLRSSSDALIGQALTDSIPLANNDSTGSIDSALQAGFEDGSGTKLTEIELAESAAATQVDCSFTPFWHEDAATGGVFVMRDVGKERALHRELQFLATHDSLTGLSNRYLFELKLGEMVDGALHRGECHAVCYIDIDQFKIVNDTCGHQAGDRLLQQVANSLSENIRQEDILARLGGDEFGLLIRNCGSTEAEGLASRLHEFFQTFVYMNGDRRFAVRASIGFVSINKNYESVSDVLAAADIACYSAKDKGRNELHVFRAGCAETSQRKGEMLLLPKLQNALEVDKFVLFVQPIAEILPTGIKADAKYEVLLRMEDDDGTLITPFRLISAAERYDLMKEIDRWVIDKAFRVISELRDLYQDDLPMFSINLSGQSAVDKDLIGFILGKVAQTGVPTKNICFEITETSAIGDLNKALGLLDFLHELGCELALDDFGAGHSSFGYLKHLPVDYLKVDGQFVKDVHKNEVHAEMLGFVQRVAKLLGIKTVAEFVENEEVLACLRDMEIDYAQGYHVGKPFDINELRSYSGKQKAA